MYQNVIGIDLGTTFSLVSVILSEKPVIVKDNMDKPSIPSIVNFKKSSDNISITTGNTAKKRQQNSSKMTVYDTKRMLGRRFKDEQIQKLKEKWPFKIEESETGGILICLDGIERKFHPYEISGEILKSLVQLGNSRFPVEERTNDVVITIPANFGDEQRTETIKAAEYAGLHVLQLINEPTAAGLAFGLDNQSSKSRYIFVFDFGGGTLDVSLLQQKGKDIEVIGTDGDMFLGGRDFDENTVNYIINELHLNEKITKNPRKMNKLLDAVIESKKELSTENESIVNLDGIIDDNKDDDDDDDNDDDSRNFDLSLEQFEKINDDLINRTLIPVERLLESSGIKKEDISAILLVGGSSKMQFVKRKLKEYFGKEPYRGVDPEEAVAIGAGVIASKYIESVDPESLIKSLDYNDICPFSIGLPNVDETMVVLIQKGTPIPSQPKSAKFQTVLYKQDTFTVTVFEGEGKYVYDNLRLGQFTITKLPQVDYEICFDVTFQIDANGILHASAQLVDGDLHAEAHIKIEKSEARLTKSMIGSHKVDPNVRALQIFYQNIQRFIKLNLESFQKVYSKKKIDSFIRYAEHQEMNADAIEDIDIDVHIQKYKYTVFKPYFQKYHGWPDFLR